jgi:hypothetical protein
MILERVLGAVVPHAVFIEEHLRVEQRSDGLCILFATAWS